MIKVIVCDFDGVLVESMDVKTRAFAMLFAVEGAAVVQEIVSYHLLNGGVSRYDKFRHIYDRILKRPLSDELFNDLCRRFADLVEDAVVAAPYVDGAREFLESHGGNYHLFVASATPREELVRILERRGMLGRFEAVYGAPTSKIDAVRVILRHTGVDQSEALFIGDALSDYEAAQANGIPFLARVTENPSLFNGIFCPKVADLSELQALIESLGESGQPEPTPVTRKG